MKLLVLLLLVALAACNANAKRASHDLREDSAEDAAMLEKVARIEKLMDEEDQDLNKESTHNVSYLSFNKLQRQ